MKKSILMIFVLFVQTMLIAQTEYERAIIECQKKGYLEGQKCMEGKEIPEFEGITYKGEQINKSKLKDKVTIMNFWFISCPPCIAELDGLNEIVREYEGNKNIEFLSFTTDGKKILEEEFYPNHELDFKIIPDAEELIFNIFQIRWGFPTTIIVDKKGDVYKITSGGSTDKEKASNEIRGFLSKGIEECLKR